MKRLSLGKACSSTWIFCACFLHLFQPPLPMPVEPEGGCFREAAEAHTLLLSACPGSRGRLPCASTQWVPCTGCSRGRAGPSVLRWCLVPSLLQPEEPAAGPWALSPWLPAHPRHIPHQEQEGSRLCRAAGGRMLWGKPPQKTCSQWQAGTGSCARSWRAFGPIRTTNTERGVAAASEEIEERQKKNSLN